MTDGDAENDAQGGSDEGDVGGGGAHVFVVASGKGGVGKTTTVVNLAASMADAGRDVVVVDFDLGMANVADFLEYDTPPLTLHDVLAGDTSPDEALAEAPGGFSVLPGGTTIEDFGKADPAELRAVLTHLRDRFEVVIVDTGAGLSHDTSVPLGLADSVLLVTTAQAAALANTRKTRELADRLGGDVAGVIVTRVGAGASERPGDIADQFDVPMLGSIPEDRATAEAAAGGEPLLEYAPDSPATQAYRELAYDLLGESIPLDFRDDAATGTSDEPNESTADGIGDATDTGDADAAETGDGDATETAEADATSTSVDTLVEEAEPADGESDPDESNGSPPRKRGLLSKLTGGLVGGKK